MTLEAVPSDPDDVRIDCYTKIFPRYTSWLAYGYVTSTSGGQQELAEGKEKPQRHVDVLNNRPRPFVL
jgi:hypothetical protein